MIRRTFSHTLFRVNPTLDRSSFGAAFLAAYLMSGWVCQWKPFWILVEDSFKKAFVEEWVFVSDEPSDGQNTVEVPMLYNTDHGKFIPVTPRISKHSTSLPWILRSIKIRLFLGAASVAATAQMRLHSSTTTQSSSWASGTAVFKWGNLVRLRRTWLLRNRSVYFVGQNEWARNPGSAYMVNFEKATAEFREASERKHATSSHRTVPVNALRPVRLCRGDSASTTGTLDPVGEKKMPSNNNLQEGGISLPCKKPLSTLTTSFWRISSTWPLTQVVQSSSTRTLSTITSMSSPSTFMTQDGVCLIKSWKENRDGSYKVFFHFPHFVVHQWGGRCTLQCCLYISATSTTRRKALPRSLSSLFVPVWFLKKLISMVLRGGVAPETTSVLSTKHLWTVSCPRHRCPSTTVGAWTHSGQLGRRLRMSQTTWLSTLLESA